MNLKQALKRKNKLASLVNQELAKVLRYNSTIEGTIRPYDVEDAYSKYIGFTNELVTLKTAISLANTPIQGKIFLLSELKSMAKNLKNIPCEVGKQPGMRSYDGTTEPIVKVVTFDLVQKDKIVSDLEERIELIQDELDYFNQVTNITL
jgi:hypothetical protein